MILGHGSITPAGEIAPPIPSPLITKIDFLASFITVYLNINGFTQKQLKNNTKRISALQDI